MVFHVYPSLTLTFFKAPKGAPLPWIKAANVVAFIGQSNEHFLDVIVHQNQMNFIKK
jgi:hypothetical protein